VVVLPDELAEMATSWKKFLAENAKVADPKASDPSFEEWQNTGVRLGYLVTEPAQVHDAQPEEDTPQPVAVTVGNAKPIEEQVFLGKYGLRVTITHNNPN